MHGYRLRRQDLEAQVARLAGLDPGRARADAGLDPRRADVILAGACMLARVHPRASTRRTVLVNDRGIRWGLLYEKIDSQSGSTT